MKSAKKKLMSITTLIVVVATIISCEPRNEHVIQEKDRILNFSHHGTVLVTDKCVIIIRDSVYKHTSGEAFTTIASKVYMFPVTTVTNKVTLLNNDTVRALSKEQIGELERRVKEDKERFEKFKNKSKNE